MVPDSKVVTDEDEDDDEGFAGRKGTPSPRELVVKAHGGRNTPKASTSRLKHSETEQRRRSKINDRFRILSDLIPCSDQKRDKASLLLEATEYIQLLHMKVQKYESTDPGWNQDDMKLIPWKVSQAPGKCMANPPHIAKNGLAPSDFTFPEGSMMPGHGTVASNRQVLAEHETMCHVMANKPTSGSFLIPSPVRGSSGISHLRQGPVSDSENMTQDEVQWQRPCAMDSNVSSKLLCEEEMVIEDGTINLSSKYSEGLLTSLTKALRSSGVDLSQASISVQINLGRQPINKPLSSAEDRNGGGLEPANKRA